MLFHQASWYEHRYHIFMGTRFLPYGSDAPEPTCLNLALHPFHVLYSDGDNNGFAFVHYANLTGNR
jgi:hypothetical protein